MRIAISTTSLVAITGAIAETVVSSPQQIIPTVVESTYDHAENLVVLESTQGEECVFADTISELHGVKVDAGILRCGGTNEICVEDATSVMGGRCVVVRQLTRPRH